MNDTKIYRDRYYPWCYRDLKINLIPISFQSRELAMYTLRKCFGDMVFRELKLIKGRLAIKRGWELGINSFNNPITKKKDFIRLFYIPPEYRVNRSKRRWFLKRLYKSNINRYHYKTYGTRL